VRQQKTHETADIHKTAETHKKQSIILGYLLKTPNHVKPSWETMDTGERVYVPSGTYTPTDRARKKEQSDMRSFGSRATGNV